MKYLALLFIFLSKSLFASSCCGGGSSSSLIILGDNKEEWALGLAWRNDLGQTDREGIALFHDDSIIDQQSTLHFQYQRQMNDSFQLAIKSSLVQKTMKKQGRREKSQGLGDLDLQVNFEFMPEYTYSTYRPRGFIYSKLTIPNSRSLYNSHSSLYSDVRGHGLYTLSLGTSFIKKVKNYSLKAGIEGQHFFGQHFPGGRLKDYHKILFPLGIVYTLESSPFSTGLTTTWNFQEEKSVEGQYASTSSKEYFWDFSTFVNWSVNRKETWGISYSDSTILGKNINSPLYRSFGITYTWAQEL